MPNLPALIVGLILFAYWARVLRLVYKIRKTTGRDANLKPTEALGMALRLAWYPAVVIWIAHPLYNTFSHTHLPRILTPLYSNPVLSWLATAIAILAFLGTLVCWKKMGKSWRMGINPNEKTQLIVSGPYAYVRHPIYALSSLLMLCTVAILPSPLMLIVAAIHLTLLQWEARREEQYLRLHHGDIYATYCSQTGRFVPRSFHRYLPETSKQPISG
jgi:protein-S-isoprenylcysteine O-methyltransferase Ste14